MHSPECVNCIPIFPAPPAPNTQAPALSNEPPCTLTLVYVKCVPLNALIAVFLYIISRSIQVVLHAKLGPQLIWQLDSMRSFSDPCEVLACGSPPQRTDYTRILSFVEFLRARRYLPILMAKTSASKKSKQSGKAKSVSTSLAKKAGG